MDEQHLETFEWLGDRRSKIFPIDYTMQELATKLDPAGRDRASTIPLKKAVTNANLLTMLQGFQLSDHSNSDSFPVPLEAAPLFACLVELSEDERYRKQFAQSFSGSPDLQTEFIDKLCLKLYKETETSESSATKYIDSAFAHQTLFQNPRFLEALIAQLWEHEITERFDELQLLAKKRQLGSQLSIFVDCLTSLDRCILELKAQPHTIAKEEGQDGKELPELKQILRQLLSARNPDADSNVRAYRVKDIEVGSQRMSEVFYQLQRQPAKPDLLDLARRRYLEDISDGLKNQVDMEAQQAQQTKRLYDDLLRYLQVTSSSISKPELLTIIEERCIYQCGLVIDYCIFDASKKRPFLFPAQDYTTTLLDRLIQETMNRKLNLFQETIQLMTYYSAVASGSWQQRQYCIVRLEQYLKPEGETSEISISKAIDEPMEVHTTEQNPYYNEIFNFLSFFNRAWGFLHNTNETAVKIFDKENRFFVNLESLANELFSIGSIAATKFDRGNLMFSSLDETRALLRCYETYIHNLELVYPVYRYHHTISRLFLVILMAILYKITQDVEEILISKFTLLPGVESELGL